MTLRVNTRITHFMASRSRITTLVKRIALLMTVWMRHILANNTLNVMANPIEKIQGILIQATSQPCTEATPSSIDMGIIADDIINVPPQMNCMKMG
jgi:hypothetical protein